MGHMVDFDQGGYCLEAQLCEEELPMTFNLFVFGSDGWVDGGRSVCRNF